MAMLQSKSDHVSKVLCFLSFPPEIRLLIYALVYAGAIIFPRVDPSHRNDPCKFRLPECASLLFACKLIYQESLNTFWASTTLDFRRLPTKKFICPVFSTNFKESKRLHHLMINKKCVYKSRWNRDFRLQNQLKSMASLRTLGIFLEIPSRAFAVWGSRNPGTLKTVLKDCFGLWHDIDQLESLFISLRSEVFKMSFVGMEEQLKKNAQEIFESLQFPGKFCYTKSEQDGRVIFTITRVH